jgi:glycolate oxidase iron-sulfur subunit
MLAGRAVRSVRFLFTGTLRVMLDSTLTRVSWRESVMDRPQVFTAQGARRARVCLLSGCVQKVLKPSINEATIRLLQRHGVEVIVARGAGCCGALADHMGMTDYAYPSMKANIEAWLREEDLQGLLDAIIINASGCGTAVKAYGHALRLDPEWAPRAARISSLARDVTEFMTEIGLDSSLIRDERSHGRRVAYHAACSLQHGQRIIHQPLDLLRHAGFDVVTPSENFMCCGSAGVYNLLQPELAGELKRRKAANIGSLKADIVATGNIGCITQLADAVDQPFVHTVELLDWVTGGPEPEALHRLHTSPSPHRLDNRAGKFGTSP